jgi:hydroxypyruvate reductase
MPALLRQMFDAAVMAASPAHCVPPALPAVPRGRTVLVGAGKAAAAMAAAVEAHWPAAAPLSGVVITRYGHAVPTQRIEVIEAAHPTPDAAGLQATQRLLSLAQELGTDDLLLCLISGGGSALLTAPAAGIAFADKQQITRQLLRCGAPISAMNCVRKHLSAIKGGRLAAVAWPAQVVSLIISDVPGDDLSVIASGPTVADGSTRADALAVLAQYRIDVPDTVREWLRSPDSETLKPGDPRLLTVDNRLIVTPRSALQAGCDVARASAVPALLLGDAIEGEAREVAVMQAQLALQCRQRGQPARPPVVLVSGGETTVTVRGQGRGGRNAEYLLALAIALDGAPGIHALACDTDGIDGSEDNAGAHIGPDTLARGRALGLDARALLADNDAYRYFATLGDLVVTGPTLTNVNDFRAILVEH